MPLHTNSEPTGREQTRRAIDGHERTSAWLGLGAMLLLSVFAWAPTTFAGYWQTAQGFLPQFNAGQSSVVATIGMTPDLWRGAGSATNLLAQPWLILGQDANTAVRLAFLLAFLLGGCGVYAWLRPALGDRAAALAGLVYMLQPLFLATVYVQGSLAEALVLAWLPVALAGLAASARPRGLEGAAVAVLAILALWRTQAGLAVGASLLLLAYAVLVERHWVPVLVVLAAAAAGFASLLPHWALVAPPPVPFAGHFVQLHQLFDVRWTAGLGISGGYPVGLGFAVLLFSTLSLWGWATAQPPLPATPRRLLAFAAGGSLLLIALSLPWSGGLWSFNGAERLLTYPWQVLLLAAPLLALLAGSLPAVLPDLAAAPLWSVLAALVVLGSYGALSPAYTTVQPPARPVALLGDNQLAVLAAHLEETGSDPAADGETADGETTDGAASRQATLEITWQVLRPLASDDNIFFQAIADAGNEEQVVAQMDSQPLGEDRPATTWQPGEILTARYTLDLDGAPAAEALRYYWGLYDWRDGRRLPVDGGIADKLVFYGK